MKNELKKFLDNATAGNNIDKVELKRLYIAIGNDEIKCDSEECTVKMLTELRKYYHLKFEAKAKPVKPHTAPVRKYTLKPGNHAFAPGGPADHNNDNTSDKAIKFYLKAYPHIEKLLVTPVK